MGACISQWTETAVTVHSKCSVWNAVTFDILNQISCIGVILQHFCFPLFDDIIIAAQNTISKKSEVPKIIILLLKITAVMKQVQILWI